MGVIKLFFRPKVESIKKNARPNPRVFAKFNKKLRTSPNLDVKIKEKTISDTELNEVKSKI